MTNRRPIIELLTAENPVLRNYAFWSALLILKLVLMSLLTAMQRLRTKVCKCAVRQTLAGRIVYVLLFGYMPLIVTLGFRMFKRLHTKVLSCVYCINICTRNDYAIL